MTAAGQSKMSIEKKILLIADPVIPVPPITYGGIERIVDLLAEGLQSNGWDVTLACHPESKCGVNKIPLSLTKSSRWSRLNNACRVYIERMARSYSVIHSFAHVDFLIPLWASHQLKIQSFQSFPESQILLRRLIFPRKNLWFTVCGQHMVPTFEPIAPTYAIHNGVKLNKFTFCEKVNADAPFVFLGRIEAIKGTHHAIRIAKESGRRLIIAGNISDNAKSHEYFDKFVRSELSDTITYVGPVNDLEKDRLLGKAAALLMPIEWDEPFGIVMVEALACGTPVIGTARGALPEIVKNGITGACCRNIDEMIEVSKKVGMYSRVACRAEAESRFSSDIIVRQYMAMYEQVLSRSTAATQKLS